MTAQPERLHHLLDRARRGVLLPAEAEQLAGLVGELEKAEARVRELEAAAPTRAALRARYTAAIVDAYPDLRYVADDLADKLCTVREPELTRLRYERDQLREALAAVTGQCRAAEARVRELTKAKP
ncbi:hypothetical protein ACIPJG_25525 [Streptomyces halstedii]|uniref:hypothetical protein n=1 Tax=Streptomyces halstedii TaxID=1944 RepID=UPI003830F6A0